ncbi:hypothetical protein OMW55_05935 [Sphingomonas sp. BN140010]|uniref:Uncharacterized protein n=1 Tax=Sphingomonas arvum TaxID=2992113 RepID=A0ABT3JE45_9SPHN|nr:hypothetical protein [Sphingomonas sp. BN140010]MCW3797346.1 hypothetical protein [Sphingomonas sp. BN140010]
MFLSTLTLFPAILSLFGLAPSGVSVTRVMVRDEVIMRVPVVRPHVGWPVRWVEKRGPKCIKANDVLAAALVDDGSIDFLLRRGQRMRAKLESQCPTLDFYGGFYLQPDGGKICADREEIRNRIGGSCQIDKFRLMVPRAPK